MVKLQSPEANLGRIAPNFDLMGVDGQRYNLEKFRGKRGIVVMFLCNHCPYVQQILEEIIIDTKKLHEHNINSIAIMSNDFKSYPQDSLDNMRILANQKRFPFPYVVDVNQETAKAFEAVCTPDFFGFDENLKLRYRGRLRGIDNEKELLNAMTTENYNSATQYPSEGCSIKWIES